MNDRDLTQGSRIGRNTIQSILFIFPDPDNRRVTELEKQWELDVCDQPVHVPGKPPRREPGDGFIIGGAAIGVVAGVVLGAVFSRLAGLIFTDIIVGIVVCGLLGVFAGSLVRTRVLKGKSGNDRNAKA